jgi:MoxR-like ATPase
MPDHVLQPLHDRLSATVLGSGEAGRLMLAALLAGGHVLIEGAPGIGKTSLAHTLAMSIGGVFRRVQFTPDLMPSDLLGFSLYRMDRGEFEFIPGPVFAHCVLADEINRASPRVQSALLECMNEGRVTLDGVTRDLPQPFLVIATRNDDDDPGTFPLPEPQLDRFLLSIPIILPAPDVQRDILMAHAEGRISQTNGASSLISPEDLLTHCQKAGEVPLSEAVAAYITALCEALRRITGSPSKVSVRASLAILRAARAVAYMDGDKAVYPDHVQEVFAPVMRHRIGMEDGEEAMRAIREALQSTAVDG